MAAPTLVALGGTGAQTNATSNINVQYPTTGTLLAVGDVAIILVSHRDTATITLPAGWTMGDEISPTGTATVPLKSSWWWRRLNGDETGTVVVTHTGDCIIGRMAVFRGCRLTGDPFGAKTENSASANGTTVTGLGVTTSAANSLVLFCGAGGDDQSYSGYSALVTEQFDHLTNLGLDTSIFLAMGVQSAAGATGDLTATISLSTSWCGFVIELLSEDEVDRTPTSMTVFQIATRNDLTDATTTRSTQLLHPKENSVLLVAIALGVTTGPCPNLTIAGGGLTWVALENEMPSTNVRRLTLWRAVVPATRPAPFSIDATYVDVGGGVTTLNQLAVILELRGVATGGVGPVFQSEGTNTTVTGTSYSVTLPNAVPDDAANRSFVFLVHNANEGSTPNANTTELADIFNNSPITALFCGWSDADFEQTLGASWTTSTARIGVMVEMRSAFPIDVDPIPGSWGLDAGIVSQVSFTSKGFATVDGTTFVDPTTFGTATLTGVPTVNGRLYLVVGVGAAKNSHPATMTLTTTGPTVTELVEIINDGTVSGNQRPSLVIGKFTGTGATIDVTHQQATTGFFGDVITAVEVFEIGAATGTGQVNSSRSDVGAGAFNVSLALPGALTAGARVFGTLVFTPFPTGGGATATIDPNGDGTEITERYFTSAAGTGENFAAGTSMRWMTMWDDDATLSWAVSVDEYLEAQAIVEVLF